MQNQWLTVSNDTGEYLFLGDEVVFVECCAANDKFDQLRNDGRQNVYIPAEVENEKLVILSFSVNHVTEGVTRLMHVKRNRKRARRESDKSLSSNSSYDGNDKFDDEKSLRSSNSDEETGDKLSCFGCKLSDTGILWLCIFNLNMIAGIDLVKQEVIHEILNVPCPYHICICQSNPDYLYVTCGSSFEFSEALLDRHDFDRNPQSQSTLQAEAFGCISIIHTVSERVTKVHNTYLSSLSGIECSDKELYYTQLFEVCKVEHQFKDEDDCVVKAKPDVAWTGSSVGMRDKCYLVDNISKWDENIFLATIYKSISLSAENTLRKKYLAPRMQYLWKLKTGILNYLFSAQNNIATTVVEIPQAFNDTAEFSDCCFMLYDSVLDRVWNMKMAVPTVPDVVDFDGHITHVQRHGGKLILINYKSKNVLLVDESAVIDEMIIYEMHYNSSKRNWVKKSN